MVSELTEVECMQARAMTIDQVLFGYYIIPACPGAPLEVVINPEGNAARSLKRYCLLHAAHCLAHIT